MLGVLMKIFGKNLRSVFSSRLTAGLLIACSLLFLESRQAATSEKRMRPLSLEEVAQVWVGLSEDELYLLRLRLDKSGTGLAGYAFAEERPRGFRVRSWSYKGDQISILLEAADRSPLEVPTLSGALVGTSMRLTMKGAGWSRQVDLRLEAPLERRWIGVKEEIARLNQLP